MTTITRYSVVDDNDHEGEAAFDTMAEAVEHAQRYGGKQVIEYEFEFSDSSLVWSAPGAPAGQRIAS